MIAKQKRDITSNPEPMQSPNMAEIHKQEAVVNPFTRLFVVTIMVPAPRKPMPLITCAAIREVSPPPHFKQINSFVMMIRQEPRHTKENVLVPADWCFLLRSTPSNPPRIIDNNIRTNILMVLNSCK